MNDINDKFGDIFGEGGDPQGFPAPQALVALLSSAIPGMGGTLITGDEVDFHDGSKISLPKGMTYEKAHDVLDRLQRDEETVITMDREYNYRPDDGAHATAQVLKKRFGITFGESRETMFGTIPARTRSVKLSATETVQVPWGDLSIPALDDVELMLCDAHPNEDYGRVFEIHVSTPKKHQKEISATLDAIEEELKTNSIYRGKAMVGTDKLEFLDLSGFNPEEIVFADDVETTLEGTLWSVLRYREALKHEGVRVKRAILLTGPYGTGKTSAGQRTAQIATENGWTFISARPGRDNVNDVLRTARLYQPAVVFIEDIDTQTSSGEDDEVAQLLETFDGITAKGGELVVVMTTNRLERIHKGMLRPGRLDAVIEINSLDRGGVERLIKAIVPEGKLADDADYDAVHQAMEGFYPAFVREALERAKTFAVSRLKGAPHYVLNTEDLVAAATSLHSQLKALNDAKEGEKPPALEQSLTSMVHGAIHGTKVKDGDYVLSELSVPALNGSHG